MHSEGGVRNDAGGVVERRDQVRFAFAFSVGKDARPVHHVTHPQLIRFVEGEAPAVLGGGLVGFLAHKVMATKQAMHRGGSKVYRFGNRTASLSLFDNKGNRKGTVVLLDGAEMIGHLLWNRASLPLIASRLGIECIESTAPVRVQPIPKRLDGHTSSSGPRDLVDPLCFVTQQSIKTPLTHFPVHEVSDEAVAKQRDLLACLLIHDCWLLSARLASGREESTARCYGGSAPVLCWSRSSLFDVRIPAGRNPSGRG